MPARGLDSVTTPPTPPGRRRYHTRYKLNSQHQVFRCVLQRQVSGSQLRRGSIVIAGRKNERKVLIIWSEAGRSGRKRCVPPQSFPVKGHGEAPVQRSSSKSAIWRGCVAALHPPFFYRCGGRQKNGPFRLAFPSAAQPSVESTSQQQSSNPCERFFKTGKES
jgi:hypothetical protein